MPREDGELELFTTQIMENPCHGEQKIFAEGGSHFQTQHGTGKEAVTLENNPASSRHQGVPHFHPILGKKLIQLWHLSFQNVPEKLEQVQEKQTNNMMVAGNTVQ